MPRNPIGSGPGPHGPPTTSPTEGSSNHHHHHPPPRETLSPDPENGGRISPTFAQFAYLDTAVRKTRNRAYQKSSGRNNDGNDEAGGPGSPESVEASHGPPAPVTFVRPAPSKRPSAGSSTAGAAAAPGPGRSHKKKVVVVEQQGLDRPRPRSTVAREELGSRMPRITANPQQRQPAEQLHTPFESHPSPLSLRGGHVAPPDAQYPCDTQSLPQDLSQDHLIERELEKRKNVLYGYPISLLTSPSRNWMPVLDKYSLIYQGIQEIMAASGLPKAVPMLARRLSWVGKGRNVAPRKQRNRLGKFTRSSWKREGERERERERGVVGVSGGVEHSGNTPADPDEWSLEEEQKNLVGGILDLSKVLDGIIAAQTSFSSYHDPLLPTDSEFVDVDAPIHVLLAGTESIAFTNLGFYRIYVPEKGRPLPLRELPNKPSKLNWDPYASQIDLPAKHTKPQPTSPSPPWSVRFMGYEWENVRTELLDEDDTNGHGHGGSGGAGAEDGGTTNTNSNNNNNNNNTKDWITTMSGFRLLRAKDSDASGQLQALGGGGGGSGGAGGESLLLLNGGGGSGGGHPWGRDVLEPPPVGIYATLGGYEGVVRNWFPWAAELGREVAAVATVTGGGAGAGGGGLGGGRRRVKTQSQTVLVARMGKNVKGRDTGGSGSVLAGGSAGQGRRRSPPPLPPPPPPASGMTMTRKRSLREREQGGGHGGESAERAERVGKRGRH